MKRALPVIFAIILAILLGVVIYQQYKIKTMSDAIAIANLRSEIDSLIWVNKAISGKVKVQEAQKQEIQQQKDEIVNHYHYYKERIKTSPDSLQSIFRDTLIAKYRMTDKVPYIDTNIGREINYRLAQGLEAKELVIAQKNELYTDSLIISGQKAIISNSEKVVEASIKSEKEAKERLADSQEDLEKETKRKKRWRKIAVYEGIGLGGLLALILL